MDFEAWLLSKKIDAIAFKAAEPTRYTEWAQEYAQYSPASFQQQKLFLINPTRRKYHLDVAETASGTGSSTMARPRPKPSVAKDKTAKVPATVKAAAPQTAVQPTDPKPVFRPKIKPSKGRQESSNAVGQNQETKPKSAKPVFRPKIKSKSKSAETGPEEKTLPTPQPKPRIK